MADDEAAPHDEDLQRAIEETGATVVYSIAHILDLVDATDDTVDRWSDVVEALGPSRFVRETDSGVEFLTFDLVAVRNELQEVRALWGPLKSQTHDAGVAGYDAFKASASLPESAPLPEGKALRTLVESILDGERAAEAGLAGVDFAKMFADIGMSREQVLDLVSMPPKPILKRFGLVEAIRSRVLGDSARKPAPSDPVDRAHVRFLPHVDIFTTDRYMVSQVAALGGSKATTTIVIRNGQLREVAANLRRIAAERGLIGQRT